MRGLPSKLPRLQLPNRQQLGEWLLHAADFGLVGVFLVTVLCLGGRHDVGRLIYAASVSIAALSLAIRAGMLGISMRLPVWPAALATLAIAIPVLQLIPLSPEILQALAPGHTELLPLWNADSPLGLWTTVSLAPHETVEGIALLLTHALLFFTLINRLGEESDCRRLIAGIGCVALLVTLLAIAESLAPNGKLLWVYDFPYRRFTGNLHGSFTNRNHFAHLLAFGIAALAMFFLTGRHEKERPSPAKQSRSSKFGGDRAKWLIGVAAVLLMVATLLATMSRGGTVALAAGVAVAILIRWCAGHFRLVETVLTAAFAVAVLLAVSFYDYDRVTSRLDDLVSGEVDELDAGAARRLIWHANAEALAANPLLGHGAGTHRFVYQAYLSEPHVREFTHAESGYLQIGTENGIAGLLTLLVAIGSCSWWTITGMRSAKTTQQVALWSTIGAGIAVSVTHSIVDFVWYVPSLTALVIAFAAVAYRQREIQSPALVEKPIQPRRVANGWNYPGGLSVLGTSLAATIVVTCLAAPAAGSIAWDQYLRVVRSVRAQQQLALTPGATVGSNQTATIEDGRRRALNCLRDVLRADPGNGHAHARYADRCQLAFAQQVAQSDNPMTLDLIRDAVRASQFDTPQEARDWMQQAFGEAMPLLVAAEQHARVATSFCPLEASSYLLSNELAFLNSESSKLDSVVQQAVGLRPQDGGIHYEAGRQLHAAGRLDEALAEYRTSINLPGSHRMQLVSALASMMPSTVLIDSLAPDYAATELVFAAYRDSGTTEDLAKIAEYAQQLADHAQHESPLKAARCWRQLSIMNREIERYPAAVACAEQAHEQMPYDFWSRHELAISLCRAEQFDKAESHLRWCLARRPDLRYLQDLLKQVGNHRVAAEKALRDAQREEVRMAMLQRIQEDEDSLSSQEKAAQE